MGRRAGDLPVPSRDKLLTLTLEPFHYIPPLEPLSLESFCRGHLPTWDNPLFLSNLFSVSPVSLPGFSAGAAKSGTMVHAFGCADSLAVVPTTQLHH